MTQGGGRSGGGRRPGASVITTARPPKSLDVAERTKRYLITMAVRVACFVAMIWVPGWWRLLCVVGAAVLPVVAVLLANAADNRPDGHRATPDAGPAPALPAGEVVPGHVTEH